MNEFLEKMKKIINSKKFYNDTEQFFEEYYIEKCGDVDIAERETIHYLYDKYFEQFEEEYYNLEEVKYDFFWGLIISLYENVVYEISYKLINEYLLDYYDFGDAEDCEEICNSCGNHICKYMEISVRPHIAYGGVLNLSLKLCEKCAIELRNFIDNEAFW